MHRHANSDPSTAIIGVCLFLSVTICSSAGAVFDTLTTYKDVPPFLAAFWRLFLQNVVQLVPFLLSLRQAWRKDQERKLMNHWAGDGGLALRNEMDDNNDNDDNKEPSELELQERKNELILPKFVKALPLLFISGVGLGTHFSMWVYSLRNTSITHSLLWVSMGPIVLNFGSWVLYMTSKVFALYSFSMIMVKRPSWFETLGAILGIIGAVVMLLDINNDDNDNSSNSERENQNHLPSVRGDLAAFSGAVAVCVYLIIGQKLRSWLPIWLYMFPVVGFASMTCLFFALLDGTDVTTWRGMTNSSVFGFLSKDYFVYVLYLGIGPGIFGHTMLSTLLKYISPLIVSTAMLGEPITGSIIGHIFGLQPMPELYTWIGGGVLLLGLVLVVTGESQSDNEEQDTKGCDSVDQSLQQTINKEDYGTLNDTNLI